MRENKKIYKNTLILFFLIFFMSSLIIESGVSAAESWYYTRDGDIGTSGRVEVGGFTTKPLCVTALGKVNSSWSPSADCFLAGNVTIASFTPTAVVPGITVTITGSNFIGVQSVLFGTVAVASANLVVDSPTQIRILGVPSGVVDGKITVITSVHGQVVSTTNFTVTNVSDMRWWYKDVSTNNIKGPFADITACDQDRNSYKSTFTTIELGNCYQDTITNVTKDKADAYIALNPIKPPAPTDVYTLLAPIGEFKTAPTNIGDYFNTIFLIAIGLCGALAVIMIVIGGVQYMGDESIFAKTEAKSQIKNAILGLLIALASYVLLNTINPDLLGKGVHIQQVSAVISAEDTSTGSSTSLCLSTTNPPDPNTATGNNLPLNATITGQYLPALNQISGLSTGAKLLITAQTAMEGFSSGTKSYTTNNPGNIGNTDNGSTKTYSSLTEGIQAQVNIIKNVASGTSPSYKAGSKPTCALGSEAYNGYLYQYLRIYATGARASNAYLNAIIGYFKANGKTITAKTTMSEIYNII